jgi:tRNA-2-methylthio-N6-dimethylallyladenosine synthase
LDIGKTYKVLVEGFSKRSEEFIQGRNSANKVVVFPKGHYRKGEYANVLIENCTGGTLSGKAI